MTTRVINGDWIRYMMMERQTADHRPPEKFVESFDNFCVGLVDLKQMRAIIADLLENDPCTVEAMLVTIDGAFREGLIKASTYDSLITDIDRATSEDEPTEWSEETIEHVEGIQDPVNSDESHEEELERSGVLTADDTDYPVEIPTPTTEPLPVTANTIEIGPGAVLNNRFELVAHIGSGSMADVYEAIDRRKQEAGSADPRLAIKVISEAFSTHANALDTLQREALNSQGLMHPSIIRVLDFDRDGDRFFMMMELLDGQSLVELLDERRFRPLPFNQAKTIIEDVCRGLQYAHEQGVIHADIKPGNIFVSSANHAKILDFGIARIANCRADENMPVTGAHTPAYSSCEVADGAEPTEQDDIFSMACVAYRMLSGHRAFDGLTAAEAEEQKVRPKRIETLNPQQWQILDESLAYRRADRPESIEIFLTAFSGTAPVVQTEDNSPDDRKRTAISWTSQGLPLRFGVPAIAIILVAITVALFWPESETTPLPVAQTEIAAPPPRLEAENIITLSNPAETLPDQPDEPLTSIESAGAIDSVEPVATLATSAPQQPPAPIVARAEPPITTSEVQIEEPKPAPEPKPTRFDELKTLADNAMNDGRLLEPPQDSAREYVAELAKLAPDSSAAQQSRTRLAELMLLEAMVAITDEEFDIATRWISNTRALDVPEDMTKRFEVELQKARDAKSTRQVESLGTIFASATPAAILADPSIDYGDDRESAPSIDANEDSAASGTASIEPGTSPGLNKSMSLAMVLPGALPGESNNVSNEFPAGELVDTAQRDIPLSALEFKKFVEPKTPRGWRGKGSGWVDIRFRITTEGRTEDITIVAAEPDDRFDKPAISAISKWRFKPVYVDGIASEKYSAVRLRFKTE